MSRVVCRVRVSVILSYVPNVYRRGGENTMCVLDKNKKKKNENC